jgi:hypothetical protein
MSGLIYYGKVQPGKEFGEVMEKVLREKKPEAFKGDLGKMQPNPW